MKTCALLLLWILAQCCCGQDLRTDNKYCGQRSVQGDYTIEGDYRVSVSITETENTDIERLNVTMDSGHLHAIKYSDVKVRVYDQFDEEIRLSPSVKYLDVYNLAGDAEQSGSYNLELKHGQSARMVKVTWRHSELTFAVPDASASIVEEKSGPILEVMIRTGNESAIKYTDVNARAFGKQGSQRILLIPAKAGVGSYEASLDGAKNVGRYRMLFGPGFKAAYVYVAWNDYDIGFYVPEGIPRRE